MDSTQPTETNEAARRLDSIAWAAFFIWVGIVMLMAVAPILIIVLGVWLLGRAVVGVRR